MANTQKLIIGKIILKNLISEHFKETQSKIAKKILENFNDEVKNFKQVCPKEMLDKLLNPLSLKVKISKVSLIKLSNFLSYNLIHYIFFLNHFF